MFGYSQKMIEIEASIKGKFTLYTAYLSNAILPNLHTCGNY